MKKKQIATMVASLGLVVALGTGATLALLSAKSNVVTNTFAAGNGINANKDITLFEHDPYNEHGGESSTYNDGTPTGERNIDKDGVAYQNLEPNMELEKDPTVQISEGTADCYLFVKVENGLKDIEGVAIDGIFSEDGNKNWEKLNGTDDIYYYVDNSTPHVSGTGTVINTDNEAFISEPLFTKIALDKNADIYYKDGDMVEIGKDLGDSKLTDKNNIVVKALVVQATQKYNWQQAVELAKNSDSWK